MKSLLKQYRAELVKAHVTFGCSEMIDRYGISYFLIRERPAWRCYGKTDEEEWKCSGFHQDNSYEWHDAGLELLTKHSSINEFRDGYHTPIK